MNTLEKIPFVRILLPFIIGILLYYQLKINLDLITYLILFFILILITWNFQRKKSNIHIRNLFGFLLHIFLITGGYHAAYAKECILPEHHYLNEKEIPHQLVGVISTIPVKGKKYTKAEFQITSIYKSGKWQLCKGTIITSFEQKTDYEINYGDELQISTTLREPESAKNPGGFDYAVYLKRKNIYHQCHVKAKDYQFKRNTGTNIIYDLANESKIKLLNLLKYHQLKDQELAIASSLLLGYDEEISDEIQQAYSDTGTVHVLSVSGMHIGVIYLMLNFILGFLSNSFRHRIIKGIIVLVSIWSFTLISGLSPAAVRASVMFSLIIIAKTYRLQGNSFNTLLAAAFLMLYWNPALLFDVGFQLSYLALGGILFFQPRIYNWFRFENSIADKIWALTSVSLAAQITTFPITLYYFHQFTLSFLWANLLIIPLSSIIMYGSILLIICSPVSAIADSISFLLKVLIRFMNDCTLAMSRIPGTVYHDWHLRGIELMLVYLTLIFLALYFMQRKKEILYFALLWLSFFLINTTANYWMDSNKNELVLYHHYKKSCIDIIKGHEIIRVGTEIKDAVENGIIHEATEIKKTALECGKIYRISDFRFVCLNQNKKIKNKELVDLVILKENIRIGLAEIHEKFPDAVILADGTNYLSTTLKWKSAADSLHLKFWSTAQQGAYRIKF